MERFCPDKHVSLAYAREFEGQHRVTQKLGSKGEQSKKLTRLYLADYTLMEEGRRLQREERNPGRQLWKTGLPIRIYNCIYGLSIQELSECRKTREYIAENIRAACETLPQEDRLYAEKLAGAINTIFGKGLIEHRGYRLFTTRDNSARIFEYRIN